MYLDIKKITNNFKKKNYWSNFSSADIFYFVTSARKRALVTFVDEFFEDAFGLQLFFNKHGFNYVHDILSGVVSDSALLGTADSICAVIASKEQLLDDDIKYLKKKGQRLSKDNNLILYRFKQGEGRRYCTPKEEETLFLYLNILDSLLNNDISDIKKAFGENKTPVTFVDLEEYSYAINYTGLPYLETLPTPSKADINFIERYKSMPFNDYTLSLRCTYIAAVEETTKKLPYIISIATVDKIKYTYILDSVSKYKKYILGILSEAFDEYNLPVKVTINSRELFAGCVETLKALNIEAEYQEIKIDEVKEALEGFNSNMQGVLITKDDLDEIMRMYEHISSEIIKNQDLFTDEDFEEADEQDELDYIFDDNDTKYIA